MSERSAFLAAIIANPDDDTVRLVYADWLQEQGEEDRAEFVRVQVEIARRENACNCAALLPPTGRCSPGVSAAALMCDLCKPLYYPINLRSREQELLSTDYGPILGLRTRFRDGAIEHNPYGWIGAAGYAMGWCDFRRGFVEHVTAPAATFLRHADALIWHPGQNRPCPETAQPVRKVTLTTFPVQGEWCHDVGRGQPWSDLLAEKWPGITFTLPDTVPVHEDNQWHEEPVPNTFQWSDETIAEWMNPGNWTSGTFTGDNTSPP